MLIAQISDCHIVAAGQKLFGELDPGTCLRRAVKALNELPVRPDLVLATGDLTAHGLSEEYATFLDAIEDLQCPIIPLAGNHDDRDLLVDAFGLRANVSLLPNFVQYAWDADELRILAIDTVEPGKANGKFCPERLGWLRKQLDTEDRPTLVAMHHPPFDVGIGWLDYGDRWSECLRREILRHPSVAAIVCGHAHRAMVTNWAGTMAIVAPSTAHQVLPDLRADASRRFTREAPGFVLHQTTAGPLRSYFVSTVGTSDSF